MAFVALASILIAIGDVTILDRAQRAILKQAAKVQEQFDCVVLELSWNAFSMGAKVLPETIHEASKRYNKGADDPKLRDWYPSVVGSVPIHLGRIICQRCNLWYDSKLRRRYGGWVIGITLSICVTIAFVGVIGGLTVESLVLSILAPAAPVIIWGVREFRRQSDAADSLDFLRSEAEKLWDRARNGECAEDECTTLSRQFQNAIFERRSSNPPIFDWIYKRQRDPLEEQMNVGAEALVKQLRQ